MEEMIITLNTSEAALSGGCGSQVCGGTCGVI